MELSLPTGIAPALRGVAIAFGVLLSITLVLALRRRGANANADRRSDAQRSSLLPRAKLWVIATGVLCSAVTLGPIAMAALMAAMAWLAASEVCAMADTHSQPPRSVLPTGIACALPSLAAPCCGVSGVLVGTLVAGATIAVPALRQTPSGDALACTARHAATLIWIGIPLALLVVIRAQEHGFALVYWLLLVTALTDVCAMLGGLALGRTPVSPNISPGKTVEGTIAGFAGAGFAGTLAWPVLGERTLPLFALATMAIAAAGMLGDLFASWVKRCVGASDYGARLPGLGGIMDRIDSLLFASVVGVILLLAGALPEVAL